MFVKATESFFRQLGMYGFDSNMEKPINSLKKYVKSAIFPVGIPIKNLREFPNNLEAKSLCIHKLRGEQLLWNRN